MPVEYYRTQDPIENFKLRVCIRETPRPTAHNNNQNNKNGLFATDRLLAWQQKLFSPGEIADYIHNKNQTKGSASQIEARSMLARMEKNGESIEQQLSNNMVFTSNDRDNIDDTTVIMRGKDDVYSNRAFQREQKSFKTMYICLATDIDLDALIAEKFGEYDQHYTTHLLCTIRVFQDGLLEVSPGLSKIVNEPNQPLPADLLAEYTNNLHPSSALQPPSIFLTDYTVETAAKKGFLLSSIRFRTHFGQEFEYVIYNHKDILLPSKYEEILYKDALIDSIKVQELHGGAGSGNNSGGGAASLHQWKQDPPQEGTHETVNYYLEIVSGQAFDCSSLFVTYEILLPSQWKLRFGDNTDGAQYNQNNYSSMMNAYEQTIYDPEDRQGMLQGCTHVAIQSLWSHTMPVGYSNAMSYAMRAKAWQDSKRKRGLPLPNGRVGMFLRPLVTSSMTRILLGTSVFISGIFSVLVGIEYPIWIFPCLVIFFVLGNGMPSTQMQSVIVDHQDTDDYDNNQMLAKRRIYGGLPKARKAKYVYPASSSSAVGNDNDGMTAVFNHMININCDVKDLTESARSNNGTETPPSADREDPSATFQVLPLREERPLMYFQCYSKGLFNRNILQGYGYTFLPYSAGAFDVEIHTWKPKGSIVDDMYEYFIGNTIRVQDISFLQSVDSISKLLNKFGVATQTSGTLRVRGQIVKTDPRRIPVMTDYLSTGDPTKKLFGASMSASGVFGKSMSGKGAASMNASANRESFLANTRVKKTVQEILHSYRTSQSLSKSKAGGETGKSAIERLGLQRNAGGTASLQTNGKSNVFNRLLFGSGGPSTSTATASPEGKKLPQSNIRPSVRSMIDSIKAGSRTGHLDPQHPRLFPLPTQTILEGNEEQDVLDTERQPLLGPPTSSSAMDTSGISDTTDTSFTGQETLGLSEKRGLLQDVRNLGHARYPKSRGNGLEATTLDEEDDALMVSEGGQMRLSQEVFEQPLLPTPLSTPLPTPGAPSSSSRKPSINNTTTASLPGSIPNTGRGTLSKQPSMTAETLVETPGRTESAAGISPPLKRQESNRSVGKKETADTVVVTSTPVITPRQPVTPAPTSATAAQKAVKSSGSPKDPSQLSQQQFSPPPPTIPSMVDTTPKVNTITPRMAALEAQLPSSRLKVPPSTTTAATTAATTATTPSTPATSAAPTVPTIAKNPEPLVITTPLTADRKTMRPEVPAIVLSSPAQSRPRGISNAELSQISTATVAAAQPTITTNPTTNPIISTTTTTSLAPAPLPAPAAVSLLSSPIHHDLLDEPLDSPMFADELLILGDDEDDGQEDTPLL